jgi:hypothetical protein
MKQSSNTLLILKKILPIFSYIFHPLFISAMATFFYFLFQFSNFRIEEITAVFLQIAIITILIPTALFLLLRAMGMIDSIMIANTSQRKIPLVFQCFLIILLIRKSILINVYPELHFFFLGALLSTLIALLFLFANTKASLHMLGISALTSFVFGLNMHLQAHMTYLVPLLVLITGFVASSRLEMNAHSPKELIIGLLIGSIPQLLFLFLWL